MQNQEKEHQLEQYNCLHVDGIKLAICETTSNAVFLIDYSFTKKDHFFHAALEEARQTFNAVMLDFGYHQNEYDPHIHQTHPPQQHPLYFNGTNFHCFTLLSSAANIFTSLTSVDNIFTSSS